MMLYRECARCGGTGRVGYEGIVRCGYCRNGYVPLDPAALRETIRQAVGRATHRVSVSCLGPTEYETFEPERLIDAVLAELDRADHPPAQGDRPRDDAEDGAMMNDPERLAVFLPPDKLGLYERGDDGAYRLVEQRTVTPRGHEVEIPPEWRADGVTTGIVIDPARTLRPDLYR